MPKTNAEPPFKGRKVGQRGHGTIKPPFTDNRGEEFDTYPKPPKTNAERQAAWRKRKAGLVEVRTHVKTEAQRKKLLDMARKMREGK